MRSSKSDKLAKVAAQAREQANELSDRVGPALSDARDRIGPALEDARDRIGPALDDARERITPRLEDARDRAVPAANAARDAALVKLAATAATVATKLDDRLPDDRTPAFIANASTNKKGSKLRKLLVLAGLGGVAAFAVKKLQGDSTPTWQAATPPPARPTSATEAPSGSASQAASSGGTDPAEDTGTGDVGGGTPGEAVSDAADEPHDPTTPDAPAEEIDVTKN